MDAPGVAVTLDDLPADGNVVGVELGGGVHVGDGAVAEQFDDFVGQGRVCEERPPDFA
jgi:hypothetical protein